jgi:S1-C subfamily serine protease
MNYCLAKLEMKNRNLLKTTTIALVLSIATSANAGTGLAALSAVTDSLAKSIEANQEIERQKELIRYQHELEMRQLKAQQEAEFQRRLENQKRQQAEALNQQRENQKKATAAAEAQRLADAEQKRLETFTGTGFFVNTNGYFVTNYHVVEEKLFYAIRDIKGKFYRAELIAKDALRDLAVLRVDGNFPSLKIGNSDAVSKGQRVMTVGYPQISIQGNESKVTDGIVSSFSGIQNDVHWFQISVPIQGGNSGGSLVTEMGSVVGVVVATANVSKFFKLTGNIPQNVNYAIKSNVLIDFLKEAHIANSASSTKAKTAIEGVDQATVLVIARSVPIEVSYAISPAQEAREANERIFLAAEEVKRRKAEEIEQKKNAAIVLAEQKKNAAIALAEEIKRAKEENKQLALAAIEETKRLKEEKIIEQNRKAMAVRAEKMRKDELALIEKNNSEIRKSFPYWPAIIEDKIFNSWMKQQSVETHEQLTSAKISNVIAVLTRYESEKMDFSEKYRQRESELLAEKNRVIVPPKVYLGSIVEISKQYGYAVAVVNRVVTANEKLAFQLDEKEVAVRPEKQNGSRLSLTLTNGEVIDSFVGAKLYVRQ